MFQLYWVAVLMFSAFALSACGSAVHAPPEADASPDLLPDLSPSRDQLLLEAGKMMQTYQLSSVTLPTPAPAPKVELGRMLFFDPILSGNKDASCATCHRMDMALVDGLSVPAGTGAVVRQGRRVPGPAKAFMPRNVPDLFNRGQDSVRNFFWDGRVERLEDGRFVLYDKVEERRPGAYLRVMPQGLDNLLAAQNMLPVLNRDELRGVAGDKDVFGEDNLIALIADHDFESSWRLLFERVWAQPEYKALITAAYPDVPEAQLGYLHLANAMSAFIIDTFTFDDSPYDRFLRGEQDALDDSALRGMVTFFGAKARCGQCHNGQLLSDQSFHNIAIRPITRGPDVQRGVDFGAMHNSNVGYEARFAFRTPPLRNVALTQPYFHNGMYSGLDQVIAHKDDALAMFWTFDPMSLSWEFAEQIHTDVELLEQVTGETLAVQMRQPLGLSAQEREDLISFLMALTSPSAAELTPVEPEHLPSGLPLAHPVFDETSQ